LFAILAVLVLWAVVFSDTLFSMVAQWLQSDSYVHGFLIAPIVIALVWHRHQALAQVPIEPRPMGVWMIAALLALWAVGRAGEMLVVQQAAVVAMVPALVWIIAGPERFRVVRFPLLYLFFAVPVGEALVAPLMDFTAHFTVEAVRLSGIAVHRDGYFFSTTVGDFEVAKTCSGVRYVTVSVALSTLYAFLWLSSGWHRTILLVCGVLVPIVANALRAYGIVMLAHLSNLELAVSADHTIYGLIFFVPVVGCLMWVGSRLRRAEAALDVAPTPATASTPQPAAMPGASLRAAALCAAVLLLAPAVGQVQTLVRFAPATAACQIELPQAPDGWSGPAAAEEANRASFHGTSATQAGTYSRGGRSLELQFISYCSPRPEGSELINADNRAFDPASWSVTGVTTRRAGRAGGPEWKVREYDLRSHGPARLLWLWYDAGGIATPGDYLGKVAEMQARWRRTPARAVVLTTAYDFDPQPARELLNDFLHASCAADAAQSEAGAALLCHGSDVW
jgi:exosortase A